MPTEGILVPSVFLGVLRACVDNASCAYNDPDLLAALGKVQEDTGTNVDLVRHDERSLFRNSGQYWRGTGVLQETPGQVNPTDLGLAVASSEISQDNFAALIIQQTVLPNRLTFPDEAYRQWVDAGIKFKPFMLLLNLMVMMGREYGHAEAYLTENELTKVVVPLSGTRMAQPDYLPYIHDFRDEKLDLTGWPNCTPESNDKRMAREFLYFLRNFGVCAEQNMPGAGNNRFALSEMPEIDDLAELDIADDWLNLESDDLADADLEQSMKSGLPRFIERQKTLTMMLYRPGQGRFRREVLQAFGETCLVTGETLPKVIEAAHIKPVSYGGTDDPGNGLCLRVDIHRLYDSQLLRISPDGTINVSSIVTASPGYAKLPKAVIIPGHIDRHKMEWRNRYC